MADESLVQAFNRWREQAEIVNQSGDPVEKPVTALLVEKQGGMAYIIKSGIPQLIPQLAISLAGLNRGISVD